MENNSEDSDCSINFFGIDKWNVRMDKKFGGIPIHFDVHTKTLLKVFMWGITFCII